jgi:hypothetical protein
MLGKEIDILSSGDAMKNMVRDMHTVLVTDG